MISAQFPWSLSERSLNVAGRLAMLLAMILFIPFESGAQRRRTVILLTDETTLVEMERLAKIIDAHLSDLGASVLLRTLGDTTEAETLRQETAKQLVDIETTLSVVWLSTHSNELRMLVSDQEAKKMMTLPISSKSSDIEKQFDAIAMVVRAALMPLLAPDAEERPSSKESLSPSKSRGSSPAVPTVKSTRDKQAVSGRPVPSLVVTAGYSLVDVDLLGPFANGATLGIGVVYWRHVGMDIRYRVLQSVRMDIDEKNVRLQRHPLVLTLSLFLTKGLLDMGLSAGMTIDFTRIQGIPASDAPQTLDHNRLAFSPAVFLRHQLWRWFYLNIDINVDIYYEPHRYMWNNREVYVNGSLQLIGTICMAFIWPAHTEIMR